MTQSVEWPWNEPSEMLWMRLLTVSSSSCCCRCSAVLLEETLISCCSNWPMTAVCRSTRVWSCSFSSWNIFSSTCRCSSMSLTFFSRTLRMRKRRRRQVQPWVFFKWLTAAVRTSGLTCFCYSACWFRWSGRWVAFLSCWSTRNSQEVFARVELCDESPKRWRNLREDTPHEILIIWYHLT